MSFRHKHKLVLNIAPIEFDDAELEVGVLPYRDHKQLAELRAHHDTTHIFRREEETQILAIPFIENAHRIGDSFRLLRLRRKYQSERIN